MELESRKWTINAIDVHVQIGQSDDAPIGEIETKDSDGTRRWGYVATIGQIQENLDRHAASGESANGAYFWGTGLIILRDLEPSTIELAINDLITLGEYQSALKQF